ncbi:MAG: protein kinase [Gemmatimonadota bacterium]
MPDRPTKEPTNAAALIPTAEDDRLLAKLRAATLGEFDVYGELGRGGMATVYLAHEISLDRKVAIKVMSPVMTHAAGLVERFKREAKTAANLAHPNIIPIYSVRQVDDLLFCVIKLVNGTPLDGIMRELGRLPVRLVQAVVSQVGDALAYAHRHGVVHRDIKPANILIDDDGWVVVTDFGIAKVSESEGLTLTGVAVGTPTYMSPEQCSGDEVTGASDQYSLGVVAYEMLAGRPPFTGTSMMSLMYSHFHDDPPSLAALRPDCPAPLRDAVLRMLAKAPADRWPSVDAAAAAMGAKPLERDDPTRSQLITLVRSGTSHRVVAALRTPQSPIPLSQKPSETASVQARWRPVFAGAAALVLLAAGYLIAVVGAPDTSNEMQRVVAESTGVAPPAAVSPVDSTPVTARQQVAPPPQAAREEKRTAARPNPQNTTAVAVATPPVDSMVRRSDTPNVTIFDSATPIRTPVNAVPLRSPERVAAVAPPTIDESNEVRALVLAFARALAASDLAAARRLYPTMPNEQRQGFEALWRAGGTMTPRWTVSDILVTGNVATARVHGTNVVTVRRGTTSEEPVALRARLERRAGEWRLVALIN